MSGKVDSKLNKLAKSFSRRKFSSSGEELKAYKHIKITNPGIDMNEFRDTVDEFRRKNERIEESKSRKVKLEDGENE